MTSCSSQIELWVNLQTADRWSAPMAWSPATFHFSGRFKEQTNATPCECVFVIDQLPFVRAASLKISFFPSLWPFVFIFEKFSGENVGQTIS